MSKNPISQGLMHSSLRFRNIISGYVESRLSAREYPFDVWIKLCYLIYLDKLYYKPSVFIALISPQEHPVLVLIQIFWKDSRKKFNTLISKIKIQDFQILLLKNLPLLLENCIKGLYLHNEDDGYRQKCRAHQFSRDNLVNFLLILLIMLQQENIENPVRKKIKERSVLKKSSLSNTTLFRLQTSIIHALQAPSPSTSRTAELAEEVLRGIEANTHLTDHLATLEEEISQITQELAQLERTYQFAETMRQQHEVESFEISSRQEQDQRTGLLLSRLNQVLSVSRSYGSKELLKLNRTHMECQEEPARGQRPPPLVFTHDF